MTLLAAADPKPLNFGESFIELFTGMGPVAGICYVLGIILIVVEIFQQGAGIFGYIGCALTALGVILRLSASGNLTHLFLMVLVALVILVAAFLIMARATRMGWITRAAKLRPHIEAQDVRGLTGLTLTDLTPVGKVELNGRVYDAVTLGDERVTSESKIKVVGVSDDCVIVEVTE